MLAFIKLSFLITLIKLQSANRWIQRSLWTLFAINGTFLIAGFIASITPCIPLERFWDKTVPGTCQNSEQYVISTIIVTIITDALVTVIPAWIIYDLQMPRKEKITVICFMSLGLVVTAVASYRLRYYVVIFSLPDYHTESPYNVRTPLSNIEGNLAAIAACGATLKWILGRFIPFFDSGRTTQGSSRSYNTSGHGTNKSRRVYNSVDELEIDIMMAGKENADGTNKRRIDAMELDVKGKATNTRADDDARSDEQQFVGGQREATKTNGWSAAAREGRNRPTTPKTMV
jgi:hypothetical protein